MRILQEFLPQYYAKFVFLKRVRPILSCLMAQMERKMRNLIVRRMRLARKINLGQWNYFCTFTYDDKKHTEESFRKKLSNAFKKLVSRRNWVIIGVWERSPTNNRLHFHGVFYIPEMVGELVDKRDYSTKTHQMQITRQNTYFTERFGRTTSLRLIKTLLDMHRRI